MNIYELSRQFWDWSFENPDKIKPAHSAMYFFAIEHCNRLGWKEKFGFPRAMAMEAIGIKSYNTFIEKDGGHYFFRENKSTKEMSKLSKSQKFRLATDEYIYENDLFDQEDECGSACVPFK